MSSLQSFYARTAPDIIDTIQIKIGQPIVSQYAEDDHFYRARVTQILSVSDVEVMFVDFGNSEIVDVSRLRRTHPVYLGVPIECYQCRLYMIQPPVCMPSCNRIN